jgi:hypothetical protein
MDDLPAFVDFKFIIASQSGTSWLRSLGEERFALVPLREEASYFIGSYDELCLLASATCGFGSILQIFPYAIHKGEIPAFDRQKTCTNHGHRFLLSNQSLKKV